jgi:hypothetical protein
MKALRGPLAALALLAAVCLSGAAEAAPGWVHARGAYHVGVVVASLGDRVEIVSGSWGRLVGRAIVSRRSLIFVRT